MAPSFESKTDQSVSKGAPLAARLEDPARTQPLPPPFVRRRRWPRARPTKQKGLRAKARGDHSRFQIPQSRKNQSRSPWQSARLRAPAACGRLAEGMPLLPAAHHSAVSKRHFQCTVCRIAPAWQFWQVCRPLWLHYPPDPNPYNILTTFTTFLQHFAY